MLDLQVHYFSVILAAIAYFMLGWLWYSPKVFGCDWMKQEGKTPEECRLCYFALAGEFVADLVTAYVLSVLIYNVHAFTIKEGIGLATLVWLGFVATRHVSAFLWSHGTVKSFVINGGFALVGLILMGAIISALS